MNVFEPVVAKVVDLNSSASNLLSTEVDNANCDAALADNAVANAPLTEFKSEAALAENVVYSASLADIAVANAPLTEFKLEAALAENDVYSALDALNDVATEELKSPVTLATLALNCETVYALALNLLSTD